MLFKTCMTSSDDDDELKSKIVTRIVVRTVTSDKEGFNNKASCKASVAMRFKYLQSCLAIVDVKDEIEHWLMLNRNNKLDRIGESSVCKQCKQIAGCFNLFTFKSRTINSSLIIFGHLSDENRAHESPHIYFANCPIKLMICLFKDSSCSWFIEQIEKSKVNNSEPGVW